MNRTNVKIIVVAAVVVAVCLLYSWVQYGDTTGEDSGEQIGLDGTWEPVYSYSVDGSPVVAPETMVITVDDDVAVCVTGDVTESYTILSDVRAVSGDGSAQLYLEDGTLYRLTISEESGLRYSAYSRDSAAVLPSDPIDLSGFSADLSLISYDSSGEQTGESEATLTVSSHSFHVALGQVSMGNASWGFTGFVMHTGDYTQVEGITTVGAYVGTMSLYISDIDTELSVIYDGGYIIGVSEQGAQGSPGTDEPVTAAPDVRTELEVGDYFTYLRTEDGETEETTTAVVSIDGGTLTLADSIDGLSSPEYQSTAEGFLSQFVADPNDLSEVARYEGTDIVGTISGNIECEVWTGSIEGDWAVEFTLLVGADNGVIYATHQTVTIAGVVTEVSTALASTSLFADAGA